MDVVANAAEENRRLRRTMADLVALSTLPAVWTGLGPEGIALSLADVLRSTLSLDLVYVRLAARSGEAPVEVACTADSTGAPVGELRAWLCALLERENSEPLTTAPDPFGRDTLRVAVTRFGVGGDYGLLVTGSRNPDFPTDHDRLLLGVGANQTAIVVQRRRAEEQVHQQREWLRVTLASIGDAVITTDTDGRVTFLNPVAEELTGWAGTEAENESLEAVFDIRNEETGQRVENPVDKVLREGAIVGLANHTILVARDGSERPIDDSAAPILDSAGNILGAVLIFRDVTEQRRAQREVGQSEARKRAILETALDAVITMDHEGKVVEFNPAAEQTFGFLQEEVVGRELCELIIPPRLRESHRLGLARYLATGEGVVLGKRLELPALRSDGSEFPVELAITRISADRNPLFTAYVRDITQQKRLEQYRNLRLAVTERLREATSLEEGAIGVLRSVCECLAWDHGFFWSVDPKKEVLTCEVGWRAPKLRLSEFETETHARTFAKGEGLPGRIWETGKCAWIVDVTNEANFPRLALAAKQNLHSAFGCPIIVGDQVLGVVEFFTASLREADVELLETMGTVSGIFGQFIERTSAEDDLRQSEQELADFFDNATVGLHWVGPDGNILRANKAELEMLGYEREEYVGRPIADFHADEKVILDILTRLKSGDELIGYPARLRCKDGSIKDVLIDSNVLFKDGKFIHTRCFTRDVTERKRAEAFAQEQEQRTLTILESITDAFCAFDRDWRFTYVNRQAELLLGRNREKLIGKVYWEEYADTLGTDIESHYRRALEDNIPTNFETYYAAHGRWYEINAYPYLHGVSVYFRDVSQRRRDEAALRESEEKLRLLADTIPQLAWMAHPDGDVFWFNQRWYDYTGTTPDEMVGWGWQSVHHPDALPGALERWKGCIATGEPFDMTFPLKGADGEFRPFLTRVNALRDDRGRILYWFGTNTDVSEIKRMEEALRDADRRKDEFLATLAHELRNPLAPIRNSLQLLKMPQVDPAMAQRTRDIMERQVQQLVRLVDDLLDVSRVMGGKIDLRREPVELATVIARAVETVQPLIDARGHQLNLSLSSQSLLLDADAIRLSQVVSNLLTNAAKYTDANGRIWLTARRENGQAVLVVRDSGIGIDADMLPHVFELFVQADHTSTRSQGGLGIGLTLVKNLVEMHGGQVAARSAGLGQGTEFEIRLPLSLVEGGKAGTDIGGEEPGDGPISGVRLLVVDDNQDAAETLGMLLELKGHEVRVAHDGPTALAIVGSYRPDMVFLDIGMPGMDGHEVAQRMRRMPGLESVVLAALTGWGQAEDRRRTAESGFDHHLVKPPDLKTLETLLEQLQQQP